MWVPIQGATGWHGQASQCVGCRGGQSFYPSPPANAACAAGTTHWLTDEGDTNDEREEADDTKHGRKLLDTRQLGSAALTHARTHTSAARLNRGFGGQGRGRFVWLEDSQRPTNWWPLPLNGSHHNRDGRNGAPQKNQQKGSAWQPPPSTRLKEEGVTQGMHGHGGKGGMSEGCVPGGEGSTQMREHVRVGWHEGV